MNIFLMIAVIIFVFYFGFFIGIHLMKKENGIGYFVITEDSSGNKSVYVSAKKSLEDVSKKRMIFLNVKTIKFRDTQK